MTVRARTSRRLLLAALACGAIAGLTSLSTVRAASSSTAAPKPTILVFGDSLSAGYGLARDTGWVTLLQRRLAAEHFDYDVSNASISGETTSGGAERIDEALARVRPAIVIVELGGNDALRGLSLDSTKANLETIVKRSQATHAQVLIVGMQIPPNYGKPYGDRFAALFREVAGKFHTALVPFFFAGFAERLELFQTDRIHPTAEAQSLLVDNVWPALRPLLVRH